jgi:hypothetical protein
MTWDEFKKFVDDKLAADGFDGKIRLQALKYSDTGRKRIDAGVLNPDRGPEAGLQVWNT